MEASDTSADRSAWQFSLRSLMIVVTLVALVVGSGMWLDGAGALGCVFLMGLGLLGYAIYSRRKRVRFVTAILLLILVAGIGLICFFGPHTSAAFECNVCGARKGVLSCFGLTVYQREFDTWRSKWYQKAGLDLHEHRWIPLFANKSQWGGNRAVEEYSWGSTRLTLLIEASRNADQQAFSSLAREYNAIGDDMERDRVFCGRCRKAVDAAENADRKP